MVIVQNADLMEHVVSYQRQSTHPPPSSQSDFRAYVWILWLNCFGCAFFNVLDMGINPSMHADYLLTLSLMDQYRYY